MNNTAKTTQIIITETMNTDPLVDATSALHNINQASELLDVLLQNANIDEDENIKTGQLLSEISHLLFTAQMHLGDFDEYTEITENFN